MLLSVQKICSLLQMGLFVNGIIEYLEKASHTMEFNQYNHQYMKTTS